MVAGDTAQAHAIRREHDKKLKEGDRASFRVLDAAMAGDCGRARSMMDAALAAKKIPQSAASPMNYMLAQCHLHDGSYEEAVAALRGIVEREVYYGDSAALIPVAWFFLGDAYERMGDTERATAAYRKLLELWKDGDADLTCRQEARRRLDRLAGIRSM
jgi:tetratricopeptide (TPR) repeat protein